MEALAYLALSNEPQYTRISDAPIERYKNIAKVSSKHKQGDLIFSVRWDPRRELIRDTEAYECNRENFFLLVETFIGIVCNELTKIETNEAIEFTSVFELNNHISDEANIIFTSPEPLSFGDHSKAYFLMWCWGQAYDNCFCAPEITIQAHGEIIDVHGWVFNMFKPFLTDSTIILSD